MKENFLHYLWKFQLFDLDKLIAVKGEEIQVISPGIHNQDSGPDFLNARIRLDNQLWVGTVEIHLNSSHWYWHQHEIDQNYDAVILHVVWDHDVDVFMSNNKSLPTLELKGYISQDLLSNYFKLSKMDSKWIPCEEQISEIDSFLLNNWLERLYVERLERKSFLIMDLLKEYKNDWEAVLFCLLAKSFGLNKNGNTFYRLARSIPFVLVQKYSSEPEKLDALLFGQGGFLDNESDVPYVKKLHKEYQFLKTKHGLKPIANHEFQFFRMRPANFPTIRISQLSALYSDSKKLFSVLMNKKVVQGFYKVFDIQVNEFWQWHYTFDKASKRSSKNLTKPFVDLLLINTIISLKFAYTRALGQNIETELIELLYEIKSEKNTIVDGFSRLGIQSKNAFDSQSLLELKKNYCEAKRCLECVIGNKLLRSNNSNTSS